MRLSEDNTQQQPKEKRAQKYQGFALRPEDKERLDQLPPHHREILLAEGNYQDIAAKLGIAMGTVRSRLHRARAALTQLRRNNGESESPVGNTSLN